jgi:hypothetical protein
MHVYICIRIYVCMHAYMYIYMYMCVCTYVMHVCNICNVRMSIFVWWVCFFRVLKLSLCIISSVPVQDTAVDRNVCIISSVPVVRYSC